MLKLKKNILIIGMTGVGKTTIGRLLSKKLKKKFFDSDHEIELASGLRISDFFLKFGEEEFRKLEKKIITKLINNNYETIISSGAGFLNEPKFIDFVFSNTTSIFLNASISTINQRLKENLRNRPKLTGGNLKDKLKEMYSSRIKNYQKAQIKIDVDELSIPDILSIILSNLENYE